MSDSRQDMLQLLMPSHFRIQSKKQREGLQSLKLSYPHQAFDLLTINSSACTTVASDKGVSMRTVIVPNVWLADSGNAAVLLRNPMHAELPPPPAPSHIGPEVSDSCESMRLPAEAKPSGLGAATRHRRCAAARRHRVKTEGGLPPPPPPSLGSAVGRALR